MGGSCGACGREAGTCASVSRRLINAGWAKDRLTRWGIITIWGGDVGIGPRRTLPAILGGLWGKAGVVLSGWLCAPAVGRRRRQIHGRVSPGSSALLLLQELL